MGEDFWNRIGHAHLLRIRCRVLVAVIAAIRLDRRIMKNKIIAALLEERRGYENRGLIERIEAVDAALAELGHVVETSSVEPMIEKAMKIKPRKKKR